MIHSLEKMKYSNNRISHFFNGMRSIPAFFSQFEITEMKILLRDVRKEVKF